MNNVSLIIVAVLQFLAELMRFIMWLGERIGF